MIWGKAEAVEFAEKSFREKYLSKGIKITKVSGGETNTWLQCSKKVSGVRMFFSWVRAKDAVAGTCTLLTTTDDSMKEADVAKYLRDGRRCLLKHACHSAHISFQGFESAVGNEP